MAGRGELPEMMRVDLGVRAAHQVSEEAAALPIQCSSSSLAQLSSQDSLFSLKSVPFLPGRNNTSTHPPTLPLTLFQQNAVLLFLSVPGKEQSCS